MTATPPLLARTSALFLDLDGTLAPIQDDPRDVFLAPETIALLERVALFLGGAVAILSGRDLRDLDLRTPRALLRIGAHGLEAAAAGDAPTELPPASPPRLLAKLAKIAEAHDGVWLEGKGPVIAIHYRKSPHFMAEIFEDVQRAIHCEPGYSAQLGKMVVEAKPAGANKGAALAAAMQAPPFSGRTPVMAGDDTTDEDAFGVARDLGGFSVKVGAGDTGADYRLDDPAAVIDWLKRSLG